MFILKKFKESFFVVNHDDRFIKLSSDFFDSKNPKYLSNIFVIYIYNI